jgi:hypothetical protein
MATDEDFAKLLGAAILGGGALWLVAKAAQNNEDRRAGFVSRIESELRAIGIDFVSASFGRAAGNIPVWTVLYRDHFSSLRQNRVPLAAGAAPYDENALRSIVGTFA